MIRRGQAEQARTRVMARTLTPKMVMATALTMAITKTRKRQTKTSR